MERYFKAQFNSANRTNISAQEFVETLFPPHEVLDNYYLLGGDLERYHRAIDKAIHVLKDAPMGIVQFDLNPYNILDNAVIDFEMVGYGPLGYDGYIVSRWHRWFNNERASKYSMKYILSDAQIARCNKLIEDIAAEHGLSSPQQYLQAFYFLKSAWGFSSHHHIYDEPESKQEFYKFRAAILTSCVDQFLGDELIDPLTFPYTTVPAT